jgi:hypothetical protein
VLAHQEKRCYSAMRLTLRFRSGHCASQSLLHASPVWPSLATRAARASCPLRAFYDAAS